MPATGTATLCLSDIEGFEALTARMPTTDERARMGIPDGVPVLVLRRHGHDQVSRADMVTVTIDATPLPDPDGTREVVRKVLHLIVEDLTNTADDLAILARQLGGRPPRDAAAVLAELRLRRAEQYAGAEALEALARDHTEQEDDQ